MTDILDLIDKLKQRLILVLKQRNITLSTAESCTGGMVGACLTSIPGISAHYGYGFVTYSNDAKQKLIGVNAETLKKHGAVSAETAIEMAQGALKVSGADIAVSVTGIAGPGGGTDEKPVGTVWIAVASKTEIHTQKMSFGDDRLRTIERTVNQTFANLLRLLNKELCGR